MAAIPIEKDAVDGPIPIEILARVAARMGEPDRAIAALQKLLSIPYQMAHWLQACRSLLRCSGSIRCSIRSGMIRASKNSPPRPRRKARNLKWNAEDGPWCPTMDATERVPPIISVAW